MIRMRTTVALSALLCTGVLAGCGEKSDDEESKAGAAAQSTAEFCATLDAFNEAGDTEVLSTEATEVETAEAEANVEETPEDSEKA